MSDIWKFTWIGPGITNTINNNPVPNIGDAILSKTGNIVTLTPANRSSIYSIPAWEFNLDASPNKPFTTSSSVNDMEDGKYTPDQNYFFPVDLHTVKGVQSNFFYLFLNTDGFFEGLFISGEAIEQYPLHERKFLSDYWDPSTSSNVPPNTNLQYVVHGENANSSWYFITSLHDAVISFPKGNIQYASSVKNITTTTATPTDTTTDTSMNGLSANERLYNRLLNENKQINEYIALIKTQQDTDIQKSKYETPKINKMILIYNILFYLYYILLFLICFYLFMVNKTWSMNVKIIVAILFVLYPLVITTIEYYWFKYMFMLYYLIYGTPIGNEPVERNIKNISMVQRPYDGILPLSSGMYNSI
jgi:hypothetical protein